MCCALKFCFGFCTHEPDAESRFETTGSSFKRQLPHYFPVSLPIHSLHGPKIFIKSIESRSNANSTPGPMYDKAYFPDYIAVAPSGGRFHPGDAVLRAGKIRELVFFMLHV